MQLLDHFMHRTGKLGPESSTGVDQCGYAGIILAAASRRYGIPGYPHKLGLLLYGPPGTGKTSMIKVLARCPAFVQSSSLVLKERVRSLGLLEAQHTDRSIVNVPLARLKTNTELMQLRPGCRTIISCFG